MTAVDDVLDRRRQRPVHTGQIHYGTGVAGKRVARVLRGYGMLPASPVQTNKLARHWSRQLPVKRLAKPDEIAHGIDLLLRPSAAYDWRFSPAGRRNDRRITSSKAASTRERGMIQNDNTYQREERSNAYRVRNTVSL